MDMWFQHHKRHLYTWQSPGDGVRNQIDYITMNISHRSIDNPEQTVEVTMFQLSRL